MDKQECGLAEKLQQHFNLDEQRALTATEVEEVNRIDSICREILARENQRVTTEETSGGLQRVEIRHIPGESICCTEVYVDGHKIPYVRGYNVNQQAGMPPNVTLDLGAVDLYIDEPMMLWNKQLKEQMNIVFPNRK